MEYEITKGKCIIYEGAEIEDEFFKDNTEFTEVVFPDTLKTIGDQAFDGCSKLKSVTIPRSVTRIGVGAFSCCDSLESIKVEEGNPKYRSLDNCCLLRGSKTLVFGCKNSQIPDYVETIGESAFMGMGLVQMIIPHGVRCIEQDAFAFNTFLTSIFLPNTLERIGSHAFYYCDELKSIDIPGSTVNIGENAFLLCKNLKTISLQNGIKTISELAFSSCGVKSIKIPPSVTSIESYAFCDCKHLTSIEIPDSIVSFGYNIWRGCDNIKDIYLPSGGPMQYNSFRKEFKKSRSSFHEVFGINPYRNYTLHVPAGTEATFGKDPFFCQFGAIVII